MQTVVGSFIVSIPVAIYQKIQNGYWFGPQVYCSESFPSASLEKAFIIHNFLAVYLLPLTTICVSYTAMLHQMGQPAVEPIDNNLQVDFNSVNWFNLNILCFEYIRNSLPWNVLIKPLHLIQSLFLNNFRGDHSIEMVLNSNTRFLVWLWQSFGISCKKDLQKVSETREIRKKEWKLDNWRVEIEKEEVNIICFIKHLQK